MIRFSETMERDIQEDGVLYTGAYDRVIAPNAPTIPYDHGIHLIVSSGHDATDTPRAIARRYLMGLGVAKTTAESGVTRDAWANTRLERGNRLSVYGRNPENDEAWRKPVNPSKKKYTSILTARDDVSALAKFFARYLPKWEERARTMQLLPKGEGDGQDVLFDIGHAYKLFDAPQHDVVLIKQPHLDGFHFVVSPKKGFARQWQTRLPGQGDDNVTDALTQSSVEGWGIAEGVLQLFGNRGEIHNSGNWADRLKIAEDFLDGRLSKVGLGTNRKLEKRKHRPDLADDQSAIDTHTHVHVYIPRRGHKVVLPFMKLDEAERLLVSADSTRAQAYQAVIDHWHRLPKVTEEDLLMAKQRLGFGKLASFLATQLRGPLLG